MAAASFASGVCKRCYSAAASSANQSTLRRAMLYVPGSDDRKLQKAIGQADVDSFCFDLEDSVAVARKEGARQQVLQALEAAQDLPSERCVRVNDTSTRFFEEDMKTVLASPHLNSLVIPKVNSPEEIKSISALIDKHAANSRVGIIASLESPKAILFAKEIAASSPRLAALLFAAEDYCHASGIKRTASRNELAFARSMTVHAAKAYGLQAIDMVTIAFRDTNILSEEAEEGSRLGFDGKQAIHPAQVSLIQGAFSPSESEVKRALTILEQNEEAEKAGKGAFGLQEDSGTATMIDAPMLLQARSLLRRAKAAGIDIGQGNFL